MLRILILIELQQYLPLMPYENQVPYPNEWVAYSLQHETARYVDGTDN